uniref:LEM domain-containing protein n=1 Tax=Heterorhabditis bacteriophora TaxID=37862 RepID=A0A1I7WVJ9_HETBA
MDLDNLSDVELRQELISRGKNIGPVTPSTRSLYVKKLHKLIQEEAGDYHPTEITPAEDTEGFFSEQVSNHEMNGDSSVEIHEEAEELPRQRRMRAPSPMLITEQLDEDDDMHGEESVRYLTTAEMQECDRRSSPRNQNHGGKMVILAVSALTIIVFLFFLSDHVSKITNRSTVEEI